MNRKLTYKIINIAILLCVILLVVSFQWKESFDLSRKINAEKLSAFGTILSALFSAYSIYLIRSQISESIEQRKAISRPDLFPEDCSIFFEEIISNNELPILNFYQSDEGDFNKMPVRIKVHNFGSGVAKNITISWNYYLPHLLQSLIGKYNYIPSYDLDTHKNFLKPNESFFVNIPTIVLYSVAPKVDKFIVPFLSFDEDFKRFSFTMSLNYFDSYDKYIVKRYNCTLTCISSIISFKVDLNNENN